MNGSISTIACSDRGNNPAYLCDCLPGAERPTSARGSTRRRLSRDLEIYIPLTVNVDAECTRPSHYPKLLEQARKNLAEMAGPLDLWKTRGERFKAHLDSSGSPHRQHPSGAQSDIAGRRTPRDQFVGVAGSTSFLQRPPRPGSASRTMTGT